MERGILSKDLIFIGTNIIIWFFKFNVQNSKWKLSVRQASICSQRHLPWRNHPQREKDRCKIKKSIRKTNLGKSGNREIYTKKSTLSSRTACFQKCTKESLENINEWNHFFFSKASSHPLSICPMMGCVPHSTVCIPATISIQRCLLTYGETRRSSGFTLAYFATVCR